VGQRARVRDGRQDQVQHLGRQVVQHLRTTTSQDDTMCIDGRIVRAARGHCRGARAVRRPRALTAAPRRSWCDKGVTFSVCGVRVF
jgi:hypothetical protein